MTGFNSNLIRDFYSLTEAATLLDAEADDLIHQAANGVFPLYVIADKWKAQRIYQYDQTIELGNNPGDALKVSFRGPTPPEMPDSDDPEFEAKMATWHRAHDCRDLVVGNLVNYGKHVGHAALYQLTLDGLVPIAKKCIEEYRIRPDTAKVEIDLFRFFDMAEGSQDMFFIPENEILVQDVFNKGKLVVKSEDIKGLLDSENDSTELKPEGGVKRDTLLKLVIGMAIMGYKYDPKMAKNPAIKEIDGDLLDLGIGITDDTIRKALKEATSLLPIDPHKT